MKLQNLFLFVVVAIMALTACQKEEIAPVSTETVKIFMSVPQKSTGLKSATTTTATQRVEIKNGDTITVENVKNINTLFCAEDEMGFKVYGEWTIHMSDAEDHQLENCYLLGTPGHFVQSSIMAIQLNMFGLYQAAFTSSEGQQIFFFVKHCGIPGDAGDEISTNYAFRLEKNIFQQTINGSNQLQKAYTLYLRSYPRELSPSDNSDGPSESSYQCLVYGDNVSTMTPAGYDVRAKIIKVRRCKYSENFVFCTFLENNLPSPHGLGIL